jgi:ABC-type multidrug transport system fused ATPase/permease subunit
VIVMDEGRVVATGRAEELIKTSPLFREMWAED